MSDVSAGIIRAASTMAAIDFEPDLSPVIAGSSCEITTRTVARILSEHPWTVATPKSSSRSDPFAISPCSPTRIRARCLAFFADLLYRYGSGILAYNAAAGTITAEDTITLTLPHINAALGSDFSTIH